MPPSRGARHHGLLRFSALDGDAIAEEDVCVVVEISAIIDLPEAIPGVEPLGRDHALARIDVRRSEPVGRKRPYHDVDIIAGAGGGERIGSRCVGTCAQAECAEEGGDVYDLRSMNPILEYERIEQLNRLAASSNSKTVVIGPSGSGTPVLLSTPTAPTASAAH